MSGAEFLLDCPAARITDLCVTSDVVTIHIEPTATGSSCPHCGSNATRVHSRYPRTLADQPTHGRRTLLRVTARRFFCDRPECPRVLFCERLPELAASHARATGPLAEAHRAIGFALGGEAGARLAARLAAPTSPDTLPRRVKDAPDEPSAPVRHLGIDDRATRKGPHYGTILIDLERRRVIDILPGRDGVERKKWLEEHPGVEVVTRGRWAAFAQAVREGGPEAKPVADRRRLLKNLREAVERVLARFSPEIATVVHAPAPAERVVATPSSGEERPRASVPTSSTAPASAPVPPPAPASPREQARQAKKRAREQRHRRVREMRDQGHSTRAAARQLGVSRQVVVRYRRQGTCPDWKPGRKGPSQRDEYREPMAAWVGSGGRNAKELHRLLREKGCKACYDAVRRYVNRQVGRTGKPGRRTGATKPPVPPVPSARKLSFRFIGPPKEAKAQPPSEEASPGLLDRARKSIPGLGAALDVASELVAMTRKEVTRPLSDWLTRAEASGVSELKTFARGRREGEAAVTAALTEAWSNGPVEGPVNRLTFIKRSMYGRAGWRLLRARVKRKD